MNHTDKNELMQKLKELHESDSKKLILTIIK